MIRLCLIAAVLLAIGLVPISSQRKQVAIGSKKFTESVVLGEVVRMLVKDAGVGATHFRELGGTRLVFDALVNGDIDIYPEYTGTISQEIIGESESGSIESIRGALASQGIVMGDPLGFNNTYALGMVRARAAELGIARISDLVRHPELVFGFSNEFVDRQDGWPNLQRHYGLPQQNVSGLDHDLAYRQLRLGAIDVIDVYSTDAKIDVYGLQVLEDDRAYFPRYDAVLLTRNDLATRHPNVVASIERLEGAISEDKMRRANSRVELEGVTEPQVAAEFVASNLGVQVTDQRATRGDRLRERAVEHIDLVRRSLIPAIVIGIPLGVIAAKNRIVGQALLAIVGIVQTVPSLALLVMLMPVTAYFGLASVGLGSATAVVALTLYSLLPIVRNTHAGLVGISSDHAETALALGLPAITRLVEIELPLASRSILAGINTAAVINIGFATLGALIGAGGFGQPILTGIRLNDTSLILEGAIPAALLSLVAQALFVLAERIFVPVGLRLKPSE